MPSSSLTVSMPNKEVEQETKKKRMKKGGNSSGGGGKKSSSSSSNAAATKPATPEGTTLLSSSSNNNNAVAELICSHFDTYQHEHKSSGTQAGKNNAAARAAAASLRRELLLSAPASSFSEQDEEEQQTSKAIQQAIVQCLDSAMTSIIGAYSSSSSSHSVDCWMESVTSVWELAAALAFDNHCTHKQNKNNNKMDQEQMLMEHVARATIQRAVEYATLAEKDVARVQGCQLLGSCVRYLTMKCGGGGGGDGNNNKTILKKGGSKKGGGSAMIGSSSSVPTAMTTTLLTFWEVECLLSASKALLSRITDKIARVRQVAIMACAPLLPLVTSVTDSAADAATNNTLEKKKLLLGQNSSVKVVEDTIQSILLKLLWIMSNDTSATNRATVVQVLPPPATSSVESIIERIKDVDVKVRESALDYLRDKVHFGTQLTEDQRVEIVKTGLTKRCSTTYAKTIELLCIRWLKSTRFDPILLLDNLNPVLNENVCEEVTRVLLRVASTIDCESSTSTNNAAVDRGVELVRKQLGGPEVRTLMQIVLKRRNIISTTSLNDRVEEVKNEDESIQDGESRNGLSLSPSMALFLRVKCEYMIDAIPDIITDIPTLCNLLNSTIDKLIQLNSDEEYNDMDEDEVVAYEDDQNFVCLQLIHMARASELREEGSRRYFTSIMRRILSRLATPDDLVEACVKAMASAHDKESQFLQTISEILVDVEDDDSFHSKVQDQRAIVIVRQMRIIAILSIVLESISGHMTSHPILDGFFQHLSPAITSKNAIVREHGVICLSKFCLLSGEDKVMQEFKPLLMMIAGSVAERVEVRAQAALALCDLALIHEKMLLGTATTSSDDGDEDDGANAHPHAIPFKDMLFEMLGHSKPGIVIIGAEITAKLLLAGRLSDPELVAWLLVIFFDSTLTTTENGQSIDVVGGADEVAKRVGSPVRLQQLLSIFFPTYSMSSLDANDDMMASVCPLLSIVNEKLSGMKPTEAKDAFVQRFPIAKMVEYVCYNVDLADKKKSGEVAATIVGKRSVDEEMSTIKDQEPLSEISDEGDSDGKFETYKAELDEKGEVVIEASSILLASIEIAQFLAEECGSAPVLYIRALAKILGSACIDVDAEDITLIRQLKSLVSEAEYANEDGPTVKSIKKLAELLVNVDDGDDEQGLSDNESDESRTEVEDVVVEDVTGESINVIAEIETEDGTDAVAGELIKTVAGESFDDSCEKGTEEGAIKDVAGEVTETSREKENFRLRIGSIQSKSESNGEESKASSERTHLSDVICN